MGEQLIDFMMFPLWLKLALFPVTRAAVWVAETRLAFYADIISNASCTTNSLAPALKVLSVEDALDIYQTE